MIGMVTRRINEGLQVYVAYLVFVFVVVVVIAFSMGFVDPLLIQELCSRITAWSLSSITLRPACDPKSRK